MHAYTKLHVQCVLIHTKLNIFLPVPIKLISCDFTIHFNVAFIKFYYEQNTHKVNSWMHTVFWISGIPLHWSVRQKLTSIIRFHMLRLSDLSIQLPEILNLVGSLFNCTISTIRPFSPHDFRAGKELVVRNDVDGPTSE